MTVKSPPRSPHVQIYRPQLTSVLSFSHRISGLMLMLVASMLVLWLVTAAVNAEAFAAITAMLVSVPGQILLVLWTLCLFYHLANGIRHLIWDSVRGLDLANIYRSGWVVVGTSLALTVITWTAVWMRS